nr:gamma-glutamyltransferase [Entomobacter blattae]
MSPWEGYAARQSSGSDPLAFQSAAVDTSAINPVPGKNGMVVSAQKLASEVGARILSEGGNAADAAVAVAYAMAVVYPAAGNIGGGGFMTLYKPNEEPKFIDFRERAPLASTRTMYLNDKGEVVPHLSTLGWKSVAVPGTVAGLELVRRRWGRLKRNQVMEPAIRLAEDGFVLQEGDIELLNTSIQDMAKDSAAKKIFLKEDGSSYKVGDRLVQKDLAQSLKLISEQGAQAFYKGEIAQNIVKASKEGGGILQMEDFAAYKPRVFSPISCYYRGYRVLTAPPPSGGGVALCEMLNILEGYNMAKLGLYTKEAVHVEVEAMRHAYSDRRDLGDPDFVRNPVQHLVDRIYAKFIRDDIPKDHAVASDSLQAGNPQPLRKRIPAGEKVQHQEHAETTHFSVIDRSGFAISTTYTLNGWFGARVVAEHTGIVMNDEMDDFSIRPGVPNMYGIVGSKANEIAPRKTPLSSMSPTIVLRKGKVKMVTGSPGGSRIPTIVLTTILGVIDYNLNIQQAVNLGRIHQQWHPSAIQEERGTLKPEVISALQQEGYSVVGMDSWGIAEAILVGGPSLKEKGKAAYYGGVDYRHPGGGAVGE